VFTPAKRTSLAEAAAAVFSSPPISAPPSDVIPTNPVTPTSDLLRHEIAGTTSNDPPTVHVPAVEQGVATVTPSASKETHTQATAPTKALCSVAGCAKLGGYRNGKCQRHFNDDLASNERRSKRRPKRSKVDIMEEFEAKGEIPHAARHLKQKPSSIDKSQPKSLPPKTKKSDWREATDESSGKPYYYHVGTNEVAWDKPACLAVQDDKRPKKDNRHKYIAKSRDKHRLPLGVTKDRKAFKAQIRCFGKGRYIGHFDTPEKASTAYQVVQKELQDLSVSHFGRDFELEAWFEAVKARARVAATKMSVPKILYQQRSMPEKTPRGVRLNHGCSKTEETPRGVRERMSGRFEASTNWVGKCRHIGTFDTPEEAGAAYKEVRNDLEQHSSVSRDETDVLFDAAKKKALDKLNANEFLINESAGDPSLPRETKSYTSRGNSGRTCRSGLPRGVKPNRSGRYSARICRGGVERSIGAFDTAEEASIAYDVVKTYLDEHCISDSKAFVSAFETAQKLALEAVASVEDYSKQKKYVKRSNRPTGITQRRDSGRWEARIFAANKSRNIGTFGTAEEAGAAYQLVRKSLEESDFSPSDDEGRLSVFEVARAKARSGAAPKSAATMTDSPAEEDTTTTSSSEWKEAIDESSGKPYYYHVITNEVTWDRPACMILDASIGTGNAPLTMLDQCASIIKETPRGVRMRNSGRFEASTTWGAKSHHIGTYDSPEEAEAAYKAVKSELEKRSPHASSVHEMNAAFDAAKKTALDKIQE